MLLYLSFKFSPNQNNSYGPLLYMTERYNSTNYYFDGHTENLRPTHDPLGGNSPNQKKMLQIHMLTFSYESSRKERLLQIYAQITS